MRDFLPERMRKKQFIEDTCREVFELYGFSPIQTPAVEEFNLLSAKGSGGEAIKDEIYYFKDKSGRELGLRFDLTVPISRVVATNQDIARPFKRYQIAEVWRYDRPQASRYREFTQADVDIFGSGSMLEEFEILALTIEVFKRLGADFYIKINNKKLLEEVAGKCGVDKGKIVECLRCLDKLDKIGVKGVKEELGKKEIDSGILDVISKNDLKEAEKLVGKDSEGLSELNEVLGLLEKADLSRYVKVDLCLARGLEYYTGTVFEVIAGGKWSCGGGGRYGKLVEMYGGKPTPAMGISYGIDRLLDVLEDKIKPVPSPKIFVVPVGKENIAKSLELVQKIRGEGVSTSMDLMGRSISKNLDYANKQGIPFVVVLGDKEFESGKFNLKDMKSGKETEFTFDELGKLKSIKIG